MCSVNNSLINVSQHLNYRLTFLVLTEEEVDYHVLVIQ